MSIIVGDLDKFRLAEVEKIYEENAAAQSAVRALLYPVLPPPNWWYLPDGTVKRE